MNESEMYQRLEKSKVSYNSEYYLINSEWMKKWKAWMIAEAGMPPPIDNTELLDPNCDPEKVYVLDKTVWTHLVNTYSGGPVIKRKPLLSNYRELNVTVSPELTVYTSGCGTGCYKFRFDRRLKMKQITRWIATGYYMPPHKSNLFVLIDFNFHKVSKERTDIGTLHNRLCVISQCGARALGCVVLSGQLRAFFPEWNVERHKTFPDYIKSEIRTWIIVWRCYFQALPKELAMLITYLVACSWPWSVSEYEYN